jgi:hypothetical protein
MKTHFDTIDALKIEWDGLQPLSPENDRRLWQKLRLEWNYHSNHIEGNTLTYGETVLLLLHGQTHGNHTLREYEEMKAHDVGIEHLRNLAADKARLINPGDIRDLNKIILKEPFWKPTQTPDGQPSRAQVIPGEYKTLPNSVITATGELFEYASPMEVPARMQALVDWLGEALADPKLNILTIAAKLHHEFVLIHPFDDGNGRVARMLVNYLFLREGYPPIIVPTEQKRDYLTALRLADAGDLGPLAEFFGVQLTRSLDLAIRAGKGESIDEPGDVEKEITLFIRGQEHHKEKVKPRSGEAIRELYELGFKNLITTLTAKMRVFDPLFVKSGIHVDPSSPTGTNEPIEVFEYQLSQDYKNHNHFLVGFNLEGFRGEADQPFHLSKQLHLNFAEYEYTVHIDNRAVFHKLYSEPILSDEATQIVERMLREVFEAIKNQSKHE